MTCFPPSSPYFVSTVKSRGSNWSSYDIGSISRGSEHEESFRKEASVSESQSFWKNNWHPRGWCIDCRFVWRIRFDALRYLLRWHDKEPRSKQFSAVIFESFFVSVWHIYMASETRPRRDETGFNTQKVFYAMRQLDLHVRSYVATRCRHLIFLSLLETCTGNNIDSWQWKKESKLQWKKVSKLPENLQTAMRQLDLRS